MKHTPIWLDALVVGERARTLKPEKVDALAESMKVLGLQQPVSVWTDGDDAIHLVAGLHRVKAAEKLGWEKIDTIEVDLSPVQREMWEISENLHRVGLTKEERDEHIRRYAELIEKREAERQVVQNDAPVLSDGRKSGPQHAKGTAQKIADETGLSKSTVQRAIKPTDDGLRREAEARALQAKADRKRATEELCDFLLDTLTPPQWDALIRLLEGAGGSINARTLRDWQQPMEG